MTGANTGVMTRLKDYRKGPKQERMEEGEIIHKKINIYWLKQQKMQKFLIFDLILSFLESPKISSSWSSENKERNTAPSSLFWVL